MAGIECFGIAQLVTLVELTLKTCRISTQLARVKHTENEFARRMDSSMRTYNQFENSGIQQQPSGEEESRSRQASAYPDQKTFDDRLKHLSSAIKYLYAFALICFIVVLPANILAIWVAQSHVDTQSGEAYAEYREIYLAVAPGVIWSLAALTCALVAV